MTNHLQDSLTTYPKPVLTKEEQEIDEKMVSLQAESIVNTVAFPMVLKAAFELGVIDTIAAAGNGTWLSPYEIARSLPTKPTNPEAPVLLDRLLRLLVSHSILKCRMIETGENGQTGKIERVYAVEPVCKYFLRDSDGSGSLVSLFMLLHTEVFFKTWTNLKDVILEGRDAFNSAHGMKIFEYINSDEQFAELFNRAMSEPSTMIMKKVLELYRGFEDVNTLVDVGGGNGTVLGLVTSKYPHIKGVNFDLAQVLTQAPFYQGVEHVPGDMFIEVPKGDAVFMKWILHDWTDEHCIKILKNCWKSLPEKGKVIIVELVTPKEPMSGDLSSNTVFAMDLLMLTQCSGGKERSLSQFENLAFASGFDRCEIICLAYSYSVIEFHK
ncbi:O-methyltransferase family 2 protein [Arabidopsis lyrata subsp. lyrata]|uniref:O-methyltransferase family 2 protein n=1 Tax=Arabidopsis lyrata subsp. lyrata TaxID=81972 RepID=D7KUK0_ARALL|nr:indole glucosinolate O-methyltransferase 1 [Arabidopsis lyrata subsp. lyrata]EFH63948.1 O-methyltransferase family 2 protein [Arabidopsis lyrata subsp. lyrata]|eukprot:XP_002887689.1 indole glucosinolate O-methyltransferase 1 [Arabidopsis lyrata subsp. lyrata]